MAKDKGVDRYLESDGLDSDRKKEIGLHKSRGGLGDRDACNVVLSVLARHIDIEIERIHIDFSAVDLAVPSPAPVCSAPVTVMLLSMCCDWCRLQHQRPNAQGQHDQDDTIKCQHVYLLYRWSPSEPRAGAVADYDVGIGVFSGERRAEHMRANISIFVENPLLYATQFIAHKKFGVGV